MPKVRAYDVDLYYEDSGTGPETLVLVHGWTSSLRAWDFVIRALSAGRFRAVAFDLRGAGRSDRCPTGFEFQALDDEVTASLELPLVTPAATQSTSPPSITRCPCARSTFITLIGTRRLSTSRFHSRFGAVLFDLENWSAIRRMRGTTP